MAKAKKKPKKVKAKKKSKKASKSTAKKRPAKKATKKPLKKANQKKPVKKKQTKKSKSVKTARKPARKPKKKVAKKSKTKPKQAKPIAKKKAPAKSKVKGSAVKKNKTVSAKKSKASASNTNKKPTAKTAIKPAVSKPKPVSQPATPQPKPKLVTPKKPATPVLKIILCGPHSVYWIPSDTVIKSNLLEQGLHKDEIEQSKTFKAPARRDEFLRARWLYHRVAKVKEPLLREESGLPQWPQEVIGSISHKDGHVMFAKVDTSTHFGLGIDVEKLSKIRREFEEKICNEAESAIVDRVEALARMSREEVLALIFSFKESIYKTHYPMGKIQFHFHDAEVVEIAYERREIIAKMKKQTSPKSPVDHRILGFYNFIDFKDERYIVTVAEERKPLVIDNDLKPKSKATAAKKASKDEIVDTEAEADNETDLDNDLDDTLLTNDADDAVIS